LAEDPYGNNEWQFVEGTKGKLNDPNATRNGNVTYRSSYSSNSEAHCLGSAAVCSEGVAIRIVDADTLYVKVNSTIYKVDLALIEAPSRTEQEGFIESTAFTRDLCLGSDVLIDQDDNLLLTSTGSSIIAVVYCSGINLNSELLDSGYADLDAKQCGTSEFASQPWAKDHGC
jgi:endonuclease YncB( thermonuclease family)